jgi:hypothetical protein
VSGSRLADYAVSWDWEEGLQHDRINIGGAELAIHILFTIVSVYWTNLPLRVTPFTLNDKAEVPRATGACFTAEQVASAI